MDKKIFEGFVDNYHRTICSSDNGYYMLTFVPRTIEDTLELGNKVYEYNAKHKRKQAEYVEFKRDGEKDITDVYIKTPMSVLEVGKYMFVNRKKNWLDEKNVTKISGMPYPDAYELRKLDAAVNKQKKIRVVTTGAAVVLAAALLGGAMMIDKNSRDNRYATPEESTSGYTQEYVPETGTPEILAPNVPEETKGQDGLNIDYDSIDINNLDCKTYQTSTGQEMYELADCLFISDVCYNKLMNALDEYNQSVPDKNRYDFDASKFTPAMFTAEQIRESSLYKTKNDINERCRGPFKIGAAAIEEANQVSQKLFGYNIIDSEEDLYDPAKSCMACMCIAVKNYEYCSGVIERNDVTPNMVFDCYLWGCGNIRSELRDNSYAPKAYSERIMDYGEVLDEYYKQIMNGQTNGSHDEFWSACYSKLNRISENAKQRGE